jgi:hypothetical protein
LAGAVRAYREKAFRRATIEFDAATFGVHLTCVTDVGVEDNFYPVGVIAGGEVWDIREEERLVTPTPPSESESYSESEPDVGTVPELGSSVERPFLKRLENYYHAVGQVLRSEAEAAAVFPNSTDVGSSREEVYAKFLRTHVPSVPRMWRQKVA